MNERAAGLCNEAHDDARKKYETFCNPHDEGAADAADAIESNIRALLPDKEQTR